jgi:hypothetical protein
VGADVTTHPARFSGPILDVLRTELSGAPWVHDPFAGTGERLGHLCDELGVPFSGTEIEEPFIVDAARVWCGDSRDPSTYPTPLVGIEHYWIVTSPVYPNGMTDHFISSGVCSACEGVGIVEYAGTGVPYTDACPKCQGSGERPVKRHTYRQAAIELSGDPTYALSEWNMGRWGVRGGRKAEDTHWTLALSVASQWGSAERVILNTKDAIVKGDVYHVTDRWRQIMLDLGWTLDHSVRVPCPGQRNGANREARVDHEDVLVFVQGA